MNTSEFTYRIYKTFVKAVPLDSSGAGFHFLKQSINREYPKWKEHVLKYLCSLIHGAVRLRYSLQEIKGRVERDCLNVSQNKTEILSNTYSAKALCWAPTSEDNSCMMRVIKETGIEKCGRPENEGRPIKVRNNDLKLTLKFNLYRLFTYFQQ